MLGSIIRLWIVSPEKVNSYGYNRRGTRVGFQLKWGASWIEIPLIRDTAKRDSIIKAGVDTTLEASSLLSDVTKYADKRYVVKYMTNTGAVFIAADGRPLTISCKYTTGSNPDDMAGVAITLQGSGKYSCAWLTEIAAEEPVDPPEPPVVDPTKEDFDTLANVKVYAFGSGFVELSLGQVVNGASYSQPSAGVIRLQLASGNGQIHVIRWFDGVKTVTASEYKLNTVFADTPWNKDNNGSVDPGEVYARIAGYNAPNEPNGSIGVEFFPEVGVFTAINFADKYGIGISLVKGGDTGTHYIDIDYISWTFA